MKNNGIDKKLKAWSASLARNSGTRESRVKESIMSELEAVDRQKAFELSNQDSKIHLWLSVAGIAAALALAFLAGIWMGTPAINDSNPPASLISISHDDIQNMRRVSSEISSVFKENFRWMSLTGDGDPIIATGKRKAINGDNNKILIRYVVLKKSVGDKRWARIHVSDLITRSGEPIELQGADKGSIWVFPADDNIYAVQAKLNIKANGELINLRYEGGQSTLAPKCVKTIKNADDEYRVYQEVVRI